jgi:hypothetical protein
MRVLPRVELTSTRIARTRALYVTAVSSSTHWAKTFSRLSLIVIFFFVTCSSSLHSRRGKDFFVFIELVDDGPPASFDYLIHNFSSDFFKNQYTSNASAMSRENAYSDTPQEMDHN